MSTIRRASMSLSWSQALAQQDLGFTGSRVISGLHWHSRWPLVSPPPRRWWLSSYFHDTAVVRLILGAALTFPSPRLLCRSLMPASSKQECIAEATSSSPVYQPSQLRLSAVWCLPFRLRVSVSCCSTLLSASVHLQQQPGGVLRLSSQMSSETSRLPRLLCRLPKKKGVSIVFNFSLFTVIQGLLFFRLPVKKVFLSWHFPKAQGCS